MFKSSIRRRRSASARRQLLAVITAAFLLLPPALFAPASAGAQKLPARPLRPGKIVEPMISIPTLGTPITQNFDTLATTGTANTWTDDSTLPGWYSQFSATPTNPTTYRADSGGSNTGAIYSWGVAATNPLTERAFGSVSSGTPGTIFNAIKLTNNSGSTIASLDISFNGEQWRQGGCQPTPCTPAAQKLDFQYQVANAGVITDANTPTTGWIDHDALDFTSPQPGTSTAAAIDGNAAANRTALSSTITVTVNNGQDIWLRWQDINDVNNDHGLAIDDFSVTPQGSGPPTDAAPSVSSTNPADNATGVAVSSNISITFSEAVNLNTGAFTINCATSGLHGFVSNTSDNITFTLDPTSDFASSEVCTVTVDDIAVSDQDANDPPDNMAADYVFDFTTVFVAGACGDSFTPTYTIQGSGPSSPIVGSSVNTEGVVVGDFQGGSNLSGFYIQDPSGDANTATSDGVYVFDGSTPPVDVAVGDRVRVTGTVAEAFGNTRINPSSPTQICSTGNSPPAATVVDLPEPVNNDLERYENMLVVFPETLTVTGNFGWGRFGELVLSSDARLFQQNSFDRPNTPGALARASLNERSYVVLDDGRSIQNPNPIPYIGPDNTRRTGDTTTGLTGVLTFDFSEYRVQPTAPVTFAQANPRPAAPASVGGNLKVAASNVLNYFNGDGMGGGFPTARGADTLAEFNRQRAKIITALTTMNADVIGISEMENDGFGPQSALQDLVNGMNDATAPGTYAGIDSPNPGTDLIKNAIIYKPASVTPVGAQVNDINSAWDQARAPLAQTFQHNGNGEKFTFIVNHFTSKGCSASDTGIDADMGDGQGCDNGQRQLQANRLLVFIQDRKTASGDPDVLSMGDYNAYGEEDPLFILEQDSSDTLMDGSGGLISQSERFVPAAERYSFQFDSQFGELDHAFATKSMNNQVSGTTIWHINADEPVIIDYNQEFRPPSPDLYTPTPYRAADHDPLIVGLNLTSLAPQPLGSFIISEYRLRGPGNSGDEFIEFYNNTDSPINVQTVDGSAGWSLVASDGQVRFTIPTGTVIPARGHYLATNSLGYTLTNYPGGYDGTTETFAAGDLEYSVDIPDQSGLALFNSATPANFVEANRLDAVGYATNPALYREGTGFQTASPGAEIGGNIEYSFLRDLRAGTSKDTNDNAADFLGIDTSGTGTSIGTNLGAPGPENRFSPIMRLGVYVDRLDKMVSTNTAPNRVRSLTPVPNGANGTLSLRRNVINLTGAPVTRLRFRIKEITTFTSPPVAGQADIRALSSGDIQVMLSNGQTVNVQGTVAEEPPLQAVGGGWNTSWSPTGTINLESPLPAGQSINVQFLFGVQTGGAFRVFINVEALP